jgi:hypothetical protein
VVKIFGFSVTLLCVVFIVGWFVKMSWKNLAGNGRGLFEGSILIFTWKDL